MMAPIPHFRYLFLLIGILTLVLIYFIENLEERISTLERKAFFTSYVNRQTLDEALPLSLTSSSSYPTVSGPISSQNNPPVYNQNADEDRIVIYNRVPKTGSTSLMGIAYDLCGPNKFNVIHLNTTKNSHVLSLPDQAYFVQNLTQWKERRPMIVHGHLSFLDFGRFGVADKPIYISMVREPLERLVSYYYFLRNGDDFRPYLVRKRQGNKVTFDQCVERQEKDCDPNNMWIQIPFFCGHSFECLSPGSKWALEEAKRNLMQHFMVVGVTEQMHMFLAVLEYTLPTFFKGALHLYENGNKSHLRRTINKIEPSTETVEIIRQSKVWQMENDFYSFALQQFDFIKQRTFRTKESSFTFTGRQFFLEKIRPRH
ncbi:heparin sulfate O-sulfotransferase [Tetranychus urticae]|uniref:heparin sulfate O-sulfotransferase n=1 Tax=Tetranychus urticae TaxID=32264 RepID=UPI00077BFD16|nr:heparin sulfate O-sulfotransferase [Tetranychus urticae]